MLASTIAAWPVGTRGNHGLHNLQVFFWCGDMYVCGRVVIRYTCLDCLHSYLTAYCPKNEVLWAYVFDQPWHSVQRLLIGYVNYI